MSYVVYDTETSGIPNPKLPVLHPDQGRIMQLAFIVLDEQFKEVGSFCSLIQRGEVYNVHPKAFESHGITKEECQKYGVLVQDAVGLFQSFGGHYKFIAHNIPFDRTQHEMEVMRICHKLQNNPVEIVKELGYNEFCTMRAMTDLCELPFANGRKAFGNQKYKWPKLSEACAYAGILFNEDEAHDALYDVRKTGELFRWLCERGLVPGHNSRTVVRPSVAPVNNIPTA